MDKYFDCSDTAFDQLLAGTQVPRILDVGVGSGVCSLAFFGVHRLNRCRYHGIDINECVFDARKNFIDSGVERHLLNFQKRSLFELSDQDGYYDLVLAEGVLHHTKDLGGAIDKCGQRLKRGGHLLFYVSKKPSALRMQSDEAIRSALRDLTDEEALTALMPVSKLGKALGDLDAWIELDEPIPALGIPAGHINLQRLFYYYFVKAYYKPTWSLEDINHANFDWFRQMDCHLSTPEEAEELVHEAGLVVKRMHVEDSGISVIAYKGLT